MHLTISPFKADMHRTRATDFVNVAPDIYTICSCCPIFAKSCTIDMSRAESVRVLRSLRNGPSSFWSLELVSCHPSDA